MDEDRGLVRSSLAYPFAGDDVRSPLLLGAGLHLLGALGVAAALVLRGLVEPVLWVAVGFVVVLAGYLPTLGYAARTVRALLETEAEPPEVGDWPAVLRDGRRIAGVVALYALPAVVVATAAVALGAAGPEPPAVALGAAALAAVLALAALYALPAAAVAVVRRGETSAAWDRDAVRDAVGDRRYLGPWLLGAGVAGVGGVGVAAVGYGVAVGSPVAVVVLGLPAVFAAQQAATHAVTRGVVASLDWTLEEPPAPPASGYIPGWEDGQRRKELSDGRFGGSLLPTTPDDADADVDESTTTPGDLARPDDGPSADGGVDPTAGSPDGDAGDAASGSDITPFVEGDDDIERADEE